MGRSALALVLGTGAKLLALSSRDTSTNIDNQTLDVWGYEFEIARSFRPSVVIDCAFLTRDKITQAGISTYLEANRNLIWQSKKLAGLETVRKFIGLSSGAAKIYLDPSKSSYLDDPYAALKAEYERELTQHSQDVASKVVMCRPYSLSGRFARNRASYALFDIIDQAKNTGTVLLHSKEPVYRRYTDAEEFLALAITASPGGEVLESGGELIELGALAEKVFTELNLVCKITRESTSGPAVPYYSDNKSMNFACLQFGFSPSSLSEQIVNSLVSQ